MKLFRNILAVGTLAIGFSGCLKDTPLAMDASQTPSVIEFANTANLSTNAATNPYAVNTIKIVMDPTSSTYNAVISYSGAVDAPEDITVTAGASDPSILTAYNTKAGTAYPTLPSTNFSFPSTSVVIKKGTRKVNFPIALTGTDTYYGKNYVLPLTIKSASSGTISGNFQHMLYLITGVNRLDGIYELHFAMSGPGAAIWKFDTYPVAWYYSDIQMLTQSTTTSAMVNLNAGTSATSGVHAAVSAGLPSSITTFVPLLTFDPTTYKITGIKNNVAASGSNTRTAALNTAYDSRMDKTTGNIYVSFIVSDPSKGANSDLTVTDTLIFKTPRP